MNFAEKKRRELKKKQNKTKRKDKNFKLNIEIMKQ